MRGSKKRPLRSARRLTGADCGPRSTPASGRWDSFLHDALLFVLRTAQLRRAKTRGGRIIHRMIRFSPFKSHNNLPTQKGHPLDALLCWCGRPYSRPKNPYIYWTFLTACVQPACNRVFLAKKEEGDPANYPCEISLHSRFWGHDHPAVFNRRGLLSKPIPMLARYSSAIAIFSFWKLSNASQ